ncbi:MAG: penicillin-binding transpeptidase domain-containing protein [Moorellales bacterium]
MTSNLVVRRRIVALFFIFCLGLLLVCARLAWIQLVRGAELEAKASELRLRKVVIPARRGTILDRQLRELAISVSAPTVVAFPPEVKASGREGEIAAKLAGVLGMPQEEVLRRITVNAAYAYVRRRVEFGQADQIARLELPGIEVIEENQRYYPHGTLAANVLGFAGIDNQGLEGLEYRYDRQLRGQDGALRVEADAVGREIPQATHAYEPPQDGLNLVLTIDSTIQYLAERELDLLMQSPTAPTRAAIIVSDPRTGEILAMASRPSFDPNRYGSFPSATWRNPNVSDTYEPGSTFKIVTAAAALEEGVTRETERFYCPGYVLVGGRRVRCWRYPQGHGSETLTEGVKNSCNPVFVSLGLRLYERHPTRFYDYIRAFGFGARTGIDTTGEALGQLIPQENLREIQVAAISIGQSIAVTPIQMVAAVGAVANGGLWVRPHLVREIRDGNGQTVQRFDPEPVRRVISAQTAARLGALLEEVVRDGTGRNAFIPGYRVAGKTGTAQKPGPGGYLPDKYVASFIGYAPADNPRVLALVIVDEPQGYPYFGGTVAAPVFQRLVEAVLRYLGVPKSEAAEQEKEGLPVRVPSVIALPVDEAVALVRAAGLEAKVTGGGKQVREQVPAGGATVERGARILLETEGGAGVLVPDLTGLSYSQALNRLRTVGLQLEVQGSGQVTEQDPVPYTEVPEGTRVRVKLQEAETAATLAP